MTINTHMKFRILKSSTRVLPWKNITVLAMTTNRIFQFPLSDHSSHGPDCRVNDYWKSKTGQIISYTIRPEFICLFAMICPRPSHL